MALEINLVPDIKNEMLKAMKIRNYTLFACIVVAIASVVVSLIFWSISAGQQAVADGKKKTLDTLSSKINSYSDLSNFLTVKDQLSVISTISDNRNVVSRSFNILAALLPTGKDTITISSLDVNLQEESPKFSFEGQANSGSEPNIDYNVLDAFKKSMEYMRYDYGEYVDKNGNIIPAYCIVSNAADGSTLYDVEKKSYYAYWLINGEGCNPADTEEEDAGEETPSNTRDLNINVNDISVNDVISTKVDGYETEEYEGQQVVRIWRTPQFDDWYKEEMKEGQPYMGLDGTIANVPHFVSACTTYTGTERVGKKPSWTTTNDECKLVPEGVDGIEITDSSNGVDDESNDLVLRFAAEITFSPEVFRFKNHHMLALAPTTRVNVTDSYSQIQSLFAKRASDCAEGDTTCLNGANLGGN